jgi:hypothetical protein
MRTLLASGSKRDETAKNWRKLHNTEFRNLNFDRVIKSRRLIRVGYIAHMRKIRKSYETLGGKSQGKNRMEDQHVDGSTILK